MILQKLAKARDFIKSNPIKKSGRNKFSEYDYFTPEQINSMVHLAEKEAGLIHIFQLKRDENGYHGYMAIYELETGEKIEFTQATDIPAIKATNISQQIGGAVTYTNRYMLMTAYDIADNVLDFDAKDNREKVANKPAAPATRKLSPIPAERFQDMIKVLSAASTVEVGKILTSARRVFLFTDEQEMAINSICTKLQPITESDPDELEGGDK